MTNNLRRMHRPWVRLLTAGGAGVLGAALVLALSHFFDIGIKSTPVYQARVGLQPHRPLQLRYEAPPVAANQVLSIKMYVEKLERTTAVGDSKGEASVMDIRAGDALAISGPENRKFTVVVTRAQSVLGSFQIPAAHDAFYSDDDVMIPTASEPKTIENKTVTYITVTMKNYSGKFSLVEGP